MSIKFLVLGVGGILGFLGGGSADFIFMGAGIFLSTVTLSALRAATVLSRKLHCCADVGRPLTKKVDVALV